MSPRTPLYEGKAKTIYEGPEPGTIIAHFKDDATAFNNKKKDNIAGKGILNNRISEFLMKRVEEMGVPTHFIHAMNMREQLLRAVEIIPIEVIVRNYAAGSFADRFKVDEGEPLGVPLVEFCLKDDRLGDPFISEEHIYVFDIADPVELEEIRHYTIRINDYLSGLFQGVGLKLIDMKLEFGRFYDGDFVQIILADEISPDNCRLWDIKTNEKMDKDRFRRDLGGVGEAYREVAHRLGVLPGADLESAPLKVTPKTKKSAAATKKTAKKPTTKKTATKRPRKTTKKPTNKED